MINNSYRKQVVALLALLLIVLGITAYSKVAVEVYPDYELSTYQISASASGMTTEEAEEKIARPLEDKVRELGGLEKITTITQAGSVQLTVKGKPDAGSRLQDEIAKKLDEAAVSLPVSRNELKWKRLSPDHGPLAFLLLHGGDLSTLANIGKYTVREQLAQVAGVSRVEVGSGLANKVELVFSPAMLKNYDVTPGEIIQQLQQQTAQAGIGGIGEGIDQTRFLWTSQASAPEALGKTIISTKKGNVALKLLAEIKDLRGSQADQMTLYKGEPALAINVYGREDARATKTAFELKRVVESINDQGQGKFVLEVIENNATPIADFLKRVLLFTVVTTIIAASFIGSWLRQTTAAFLSFLAVVLVAGGVLGGMWLYGLTLNLTTAGALFIILLLAEGALLALFARYAKQSILDQATIDRHTRPLLLLVVWPIFAVIGIAAVLFTTDFLKATDIPVLYDAIPVLLIGAVVLAVVIGLIVPTLAAGWLREHALAHQPQAKQTNMVTSWFFKRWERLLSRKTLPYFVTLLSTGLLYVFFHTFVTVDPFLQTDNDKTTMALPTIHGSSQSAALKAARTAEEKLRTLTDVQDVFVTVTKEELRFTIYMKRLAERVRTPYQFEKALNEQMRDIPQTDPYALVVGDAKSNRLEFTIKGTSLGTANEIASRLADYLQNSRMRDTKNNRLLTDVHIGDTDSTVYVNMIPRQDMLARYHISEAAVKSQVEGYLGEQSVGNVRWNDQSLSITASYPKKEMEHADQVKNVFIRTSNGSVRLDELVEWQLVKAPAVYKREDGMYMIKVSSAVSDQRRIAGLSYYLPIMMKDTITIPEGYTILSGEDIRKQEKEEADKTDTATRVLFSSLAAIAFCLVSLLVHRTIRHAVVSLLLVPLASFAVVGGLLWYNRPLNLMAASGAAAVIALMLQQAYVLIDGMERQAEGVKRPLTMRIQTAFAEYMPIMRVLLVMLVVGLLPLFSFWSGGDDFVASFAAVFTPGIALLAWVVMVIVPGLYHAMALRAERGAALSLAQLNQQLYAWFHNTKVKRKDHRAWKRKQRAAAIQHRREQAAAEREPRKAELQREDFQPIADLPSIDRHS
ncbi:efflux RND transporter permease subunit [Brevibacillus fluminis]|uniref:Efflux RND transporter permease subunit n=1 Tax=Brevibacillus fluminis TaxID=511487 RepID=A0A3M8DD47_9BACL|nr:efflux RND transporter permease subunit [Brevibacillus fluminis]RNB85933.1 efflux RND transporter permease subunit [Brevibacillus fluminis]